MKPSVNEMKNLKDWLMDGMTTVAFDNKTTLTLAIGILCEQYLLLNGASVKNYFDTLAALDNIYRRLNEDKAKPGHPHNKWESL